MARSKHHRALAADLNRLETKLASLCRGRLEAEEEGRLRLLNLACGECHEAEMLERLMRRLKGADGEVSEPRDLEIDFVGMDIREREIARAAERCRAAGTATFRFLAKDGKQLTKAPEVAGEFDLVFVRHQNYYLGGRDWLELFEKSLEKLSPNGKLIITSYFDHEHELAKAAIDRVGGTLVKDVVNKEARALTTPGKFVDKRLALFERKD